MSKVPSKFQQTVAKWMAKVMEKADISQAELNGYMDETEQEDWVLNNEGKDWPWEVDGKVNDPVFGALVEALCKTWLIWAGDEINEERDKDQYKDANSMLIAVLADLGDFLSNRDWEDREVSVKQFYDEKSPEFDTEDGFY